MPSLRKKCAITNNLCSPVKAEGPRPALPSALGPWWNSSLVVPQSDIQMKRY